MGTTLKSNRPSANAERPDLGGDMSLTMLARTLKSEVAQRASQTERQGSVPIETVQALKAGGFFRGFQTKRFGGLEVHPADFFGAVVEMASACPSTGWIMGIVGIHQFELANQPLELQQEILGNDPDTLISSSYAPSGATERVPGGVRFSGQWKCSSGVDHASWIVLSTPLADVGGSGERFPHIFYVPATDARILNDWDVLGLRGTGSKSVMLEDVFVPDHRIRPFGGFSTDTSLTISPSSDSPLYRLPQQLMYLLPGAAPAVGTAKGAFEVFMSTAKTRRPRLDGSSMLEDPVILRGIGEAKHMIDSLENRMMGSINEMVETVASGREITAEKFAQYCADFSRAGEQGLAAVRILFEMMGAGGIYADHPLGRFYRDAIAIRQHGTQDPDRGKLMIGKTAVDQMKP